jgi:DNA-binding transcriptional LysR family regulator
MLDTKRLQILCEVARQGSFSAAADVLGYTQPAISRQIATLEAETGATLVRRVPQGALLTDAGRLLVARANAIFAQLDDAEYELRSLLGLSSGRLRMASFASAASSIVPLAVMKYRERHPAVELSVTMAEPVDALSRLQSGELDLALSHEPAWAEGSLGIEAVHLFDDPMYVALPVDHPLADLEPLSLSAFAEEPWMLSMPATCPDARLFHRACLEAGFTPSVSLEHDDYTAVLGFVAAGIGVAIVPEMVARVVRSEVVIRELRPAPPPRPINAAVPADYRTAAADAMLAVLLEVAEEWVDARTPLPAVAA